MGERGYPFVSFVHSISSFERKYSHNGGFPFSLIFFGLFGVLRHSGIFHACGDVTITVEGLQILTYARHSWPLSSKGYIACHTIFASQVSDSLALMVDESERIGYLAREDGATPTVTLGIHLKWSSPGTRYTYTYR